LELPQRSTSPSDVSHNTRSFVGHSERDKDKEKSRHRNKNKDKEKRKDKEAEKNKALHEEIANTTTSIPTSCSSQNVKRRSTSFLSLSLFHSLETGTGESYTNAKDTVESNNSNSNSRTSEGQIRSRAVTNNEGQSQFLSVNGRISNIEHAEPRTHLQESTVNVKFQKKRMTVSGGMAYSEKRRSITTGLDLGRHTASGLSSAPPVITFSLSPTDSICSLSSSTEEEGVEYQFGRIYLFEFMPSGFFSRLMARLLADGHFNAQLFWRTGILAHCVCNSTTNSL
jgi:hypothetical protein